MLRFTVFTPTFNMSSTISRVYNSLCSQTLRDFEWIVVDDGSDDNTVQRVRSWIETGTLDIRLHTQENSGKHIAWNRAVEMARGEFFVTMDADDEFLENSLELLHSVWSSIDKPLAYAGVTCPCLDSETRELVGDPIPGPYVD